MRKNLYTEEEKIYIEKWWLKKTCARIALDLNRKSSSVRAKASKLKITKPPFWSEKDVKYLKDNYLVKPTKDISKKLGRNPNYIIHKANELKILKEIHKPWTKKEHENLKNLYPITTNKELGNIFGRTAGAVKRYAVKNKFPGKRLNSSGLEADVEQYIKSLSINYIKQYRIYKYRIDFYIPEHRICIEANGDYWHCNPEIYLDGPKNKIQEKNIARDKSKTHYLNKKNLQLFVIWEYDFYNNINKVNNSFTVLLDRNIKVASGKIGESLEEDNTEVTKESKNL